jgi:hypothetical protein
VFHEGWEERSHLLANYVEKDKSVVEFGAGTGILKEYFDSSIHYQPVDIIKRTPEFLVCDLNVKPFAINLERYDVAIFSGVLEYIYDINYIFEVMSDHISMILVSYACIDVCKQNRLSNGWLSDYSQAEIEFIFEKNNYFIENKFLWRDQNLYVLKK